MRKIILTIIILAVAKSVFAAPTPSYFDATRMTAAFTITPNSDIQRRRAELTTAIAAQRAADTAQRTAEAAPKGSEALRIAENIYREITNKNSCIKDDSRDCSEDEIHYEEKIENLRGGAGEPHTWTVPQGVNSVEFRLFSAVGLGSGHTWVRIDSSDRAFAAGSFFSSSIGRTVLITQAHRDNGIEYYKGSAGSGDGRKTGKIRATFKEPR